MQMQATKAGRWMLSSFQLGKLNSWIVGNGWGFRIVPLPTLCMVHHVLLQPCICYWCTYLFDFFAGRLLSIRAVTYLCRVYLHLVYGACLKGILKVQSLVLFWFLWSLGLDDSQGV